MNVSIGTPWAAFVERDVQSGCHASADAAAAEGLRLVGVRDAKLQALRVLIDAAEAEGGEDSDEDVGRALDRVGGRLAMSGY